MHPSKCSFSFVHGRKVPAQDDSSSCAPQCESPFAVQYGAAANFSTSQPGKVRFHLSPSRRTFLKSLSRSALVLPLESVLGLARPLHSSQASAGAANCNQYPPPPKEIGVSFI